MLLKYVIDYGEFILGCGKVMGLDGVEYLVYQDGILYDYVCIFFQVGDKEYGNQLGMEVVDQIESILCFFENNLLNIVGDVIGDVVVVMVNYLIIFGVFNEFDFFGKLVF